MSGGGGGKAIAHLIETAARQHDTPMVSSTAIIIRSLRRNFPASFRDLTPSAGTTGDDAVMRLRANAPFETWEDEVAALAAEPRGVKAAGGRCVRRPRPAGQFQPWDQPRRSRASGAPLSPSTTTPPPVAVRPMRLSGSASVRAKPWTCKRRSGGAVKTSS